MIQENIKQNQSVDNLMSLAEMSLRSNNALAVERYTDKILEIEFNSVQAWLFKGCASCIQDNLSEATNCWEKAISLTLEKEKVIESLNVISKYLGRMYATADLEEKDDLHPSETYRINVAIPPELNISPAYLSEKVFEEYRKNEKIDDLTDLFFSFAILTGLMLESIGYEFDCKTMIYKTKMARNLCKEYSLKRKELYEADPDEKLVIDKLNVGIITDEFDSMFESMEMIFEHHFSRISNDSNQRINDYWMKNKTERLNFVENKFYNIYEMCLECMQKVFCGKIRKSINACIEEFALMIRKPIGR